jgi:hypothetical protein
MIEEQVINLGFEVGKSLSYMEQDPNGGFFLVNGTLNPNNKIIYYAHTCRAEVTHHFKGFSDFIGFSGKNCDIARAQDFFNKIEDKLNLSERINFFPTSSKESILLSVPLFWRENNFRRGLFTLFLRCACGYYDANIEKALAGYPLASSALPMLKFFLDGNVVCKNGYVGEDDGIVTKFSKLNTPELLAEFLSKKA